MRAVDIVEDAGFKAVEAVNADEALSILESRSDISLLFSDIQMPGTMDGLKLAHAVHDRWPSIRIILVSGQVRPSDGDQPADSRFFGKPLEVKHMIAQLQEMVGAGTLKVVKVNTARPRQIDTIRTWISAFIPKSVPGVTKVLPGTGEHSGKSVIVSPPPGYCFLTDQRDFNSDPGASYRMRSTWDLDVPGGAWTGEHTTGTTIEANCDTGAELGRGHAPTTKMKFSEFSQGTAAGGPVFRVKMRCAASDPLYKLAAIGGELDYWGFITVEVTSSRKSAVVRFSGRVDGFPAFEMYASCNGGPSQPIFTEASGKDAKLIAGSAEKPITGETTFKLPPL